MKTFDQIRSDISVVGRGLSGDETIRYIWGGVPAGAHAAFSFEQNSVLLPILNQDELTDWQLVCLMAWDYHERLHYAKTCPDYMKKEYKKLNSLEQELMQRFEDSRNETGTVSMSASEMKRRRIHNDQITIREAGNEQHLYAFRMNEYEKVCSEYIKISMNNRWGYLAMALQFKMAEYANFPIPEELQKYWDIAWKIVSDGRFTKAKSLKRPGTWIVGQLAKDVCRAWQEAEDQEKNNDESENGQETGQKDKRDSSQEYSDSISQEFKKSNKGECELDSHSIQAIIGQMALEQQNDGKIELNVSNIPYNMEDEDIVPKEFPQAFEAICSQITDKAHELRAMLTVILRSLTRNTIEKNLRRGRINKRALAGVLCGKTKVMQKKIEGVNLDTDVQIIIDLSGSMWAGKYKGVSRSVLAACVAICLSEALSGVYGMNVEVIGFNSLTPRHKTYANGMARASDRVVAYFFKRFEENYHLVKNRMGSMSVPFSEGGSVGGCNVDHEVIWRGAHRLIRRGSKRKIQFVLSDGVPNGCGGTYNGFLKEELKRVNNKIQALGIEQVAIGIQDNGVESFYPNTLVLHELDKLDQEALNLIAQMFLAKY